jgi:hypothetical protein
MADRTTSTIFYPSCDPTVVYGKVNGSNDDYFTLPYGQLANCVVNAEDDDDAICTATVSGSTVTLNLTDDAAADITADTDINFIAKLRTQ